MKLQLTQKGKDYLSATKTLENIGVIEERTFTDTFIFGLEELIDELRTVSFNDFEDLQEYSLNADILLDSPIRCSYLVEKGFELDFLTVF